MENIYLTEVSILPDPSLGFLSLNMATRAHSAVRFTATIMILQIIKVPLPNVQWLAVYL